MTNTQFSDYDDFSNDVDFESNPAQGSERDAWYRSTKGTIDRCSFVYFHRVDVNAVNKARRENPKITQAEMQAIATKAIADRAEELKKPVTELTAVDLLDRRTVKFKKLQAHYQEGLGFVISRLGKDGSEADKVWKQLPEPKIYYTTMMIFYPCDKKGAVTRDKEAFQSGWQVRPWRLSTRNYEEFDKLNQSLQANGISLAGQDFTLECTASDFQNFKPAGAGPAIWSRTASFADQVLGRAVEWYEKLVPFRELTTDALRQKLGGGSGPSAGALGSGSNNALPSGAADTNFDDILGSV